MYKVKKVSSHDISNVKKFLNKFEQTSQFLINNLKMYGPNLSDHPNSGNYKVLTEDNQIISVFYLSRRGNIMI